MKNSGIQTNPEVDYRALFRQLPARRIIFRANDPKYTLVEVTDSYSEMIGIPREKLVGRNYFDVFPDTSEKFKKTGVSERAQDFRKLIRTKKLIDNGIRRYDIPDPEGKGYLERYWEITHHPIFDEKGTISHILQVLRDVTKEVLSERGLKEAREHLEEALQIGKVGSWVWDVEKGVITADSNMAKMFGINKYEAAAGLSTDAFMAAVHPDDEKRIRAAVGYAVKHKSKFEEEYRIVSRRGRQRWILARGRVDMVNGQLVFPGVVVDITERRDLLAQIELAHKQDRLNRQEARILLRRNEELEAISRTKDEFVALASHQLRTPATAVKQYLGMVLQGYVGDISDMQADLLGKAFESNERQIQIINQILNAARVDTGRLVMAPVRIDLRALVQGISDEMRASVEQRGHAFSVSLPSREVQVVADLGYLRMAIENLLNNASVYTREGGQVQLVLQKVGKQARLSITDSGVGIKKADLGKLFTKFSRIHNPLSVQAGGSGIGLYLTAEIVRLHGGRVEVESKINRGTTFAILLPVVQNEA